MQQVKLDKVDREILFELDKNCRIPIAQLAKKLKKPRETIVYRINNLTSKGIIRKFVTTINPCKLGYKIYKIYLQLENSKEDKERLINYLKNYDRIYWLGICDGVWDLIFSVFAEDAYSFYELKNNLFSEFKHLIVKKEVGTFIDAHEYEKKFIVNKEGNYVIIGGHTVENKIDVIDKKILEILANDARIEITKLAKEVKTTPAVVRNKIKALEENGIILKYRVNLDLGKLGLEFYKAIIYFKDLNNKKEKSLLEYLRRHERAIYYVRMLTPWESEIELVVDSHKHFLDIMDGLKDKFHDTIKNYEFVVISWDDWLPGLYKVI